MELATTIFAAMQQQFSPASLLVLSNFCDQFHVLLDHYGALRWPCREFHP